MIVQSAMLEAELSAIVGPRNVLQATPVAAFNTAQPQFIIEPGGADEVARVLRFANATGLQIAPRGAGTKLDWGNPPRGADLLLSTRRLNQVLEHAWGDMTATVQAGCTVADVQRALAAHGQRLALDPLWPEQATIGGVLATNDSGALRLRFGALRDLVLGVTVALPDGTLARSGGKVVKNVAGYDLPKLMTGALGTLGVITEATFRLYPLPADTRIIEVRTNSLPAANERMLAMLDSTLVPISVQLYAAHNAPPLVAVRFEGILPAIEAQTTQLHSMFGLDQVEVAPTWRERATLWDSPATSLIIKVSVQPTQIADMLETVQRVATPLRLDWQAFIQAFGVGLLRIDGANEQVLLTALNLVRADVSRLGGSVVALRCSYPIKERIDVWGASGDALPLMRRVKEQFDPRHILNPGRYVGGI